MTVHFIGAGPGAADLITVRGRDLIARCPVCLYAGSIVPRELLAYCPPGARIVDTAPLSLDEIDAEFVTAHAAGHDVARLHSGDLSIYSALAEQLRRLQRRGISYTLTPGVPAFAAAAAALECELTVPELAQSVVLTRMAGRASRMPENETLASLRRDRRNAGHPSRDPRHRDDRRGADALSTAPTVRPPSWCGRAGRPSASCAARSATSPRKLPPRASSAPRLCSSAARWRRGISATARSTTPTIAAASAEARVERGATRLGTARARPAPSRSNSATSIAMPRPSTSRSAVCWRCAATASPSATLRIAPAQKLPPRCSPS